MPGFRALFPFPVLRAPCPACNRPRSAPLCGPCRARSLVSLAPVNAAIGEVDAWFLGAYHAVSEGSGPLSPLGLLLQSFKDRGDRVAGRCLARLFAEACAPLAVGTSAVVAVPPDPTRLRQRGYAPAAWLAHALARASGVCLAPRALQRLPGHPPQRGLGGEARRRNARDAFALGPSPVAGYTLVLVDDVVTTGATLLATSRLLERAGAASVVCVAAACADEETISRCRSKTAPAGTSGTCARRR